MLTGEHGVGVEKRDLMETMFNEDDLNQQQRLKCAFDPSALSSRRGRAGALSTLPGWGSRPAARRTAAP